MSILRRWVATCDAAGCTEVEILEGDQFDGKWGLGEQISDHGWQASPGAKPTYCPQHADITPEETP